MADYTPRADLIGKDGLWLLDIEIGSGQLFRFSSETIEVPTEAGSLLQYSEGLQPLELSLTNAGAQNLAAEIQSSIDWPLFVAQGTPLERSPATLRRWFPGQTIERARVHLVGFVERANYDRAGAPLQLTIAVNRRSVSDDMMRPLAVIDSVSWPISGGAFEVPERTVGAAYPLVFGSPGALPDGSVVAAVPLPTAEWRSNNANTRGVASQFEIEATTFEMFNFGGDVPIQDTRNVIQVRDNRNLLVASALVGNALKSLKSGEQYYGGFARGAGGILRPDRTGALTGAGEIIEFLIRKFTRVRLDSGRWAAVRGQLDAYLLDFWVNNPGNDWWKFIQAEILPLLPIAQDEGADGWFVHWINWAATQKDVVWEFDESQAVSRVGVVTREPGVQSTGGVNVPNEITLEYAPARDSGRFHERMTVSAQSGRLSDPLIGEDLVDSRIIESPFCRLSQSIYERQSVTRSTNIVWDRATAGLILRGMAAKESLPRRRLVFKGGSELESLPRWSVGAVTVPELHMDGEIGWLEDVIVGPTETTAFVLVRDHPQLGRRSTV